MLRNSVVLHPRYAQPDRKVLSCHDRWKFRERSKKIKKKESKKKPPEEEFYSGEIIKPLQRETKIHLLQGRSVWELHRLLTAIHPHWNIFFSSNQIREIEVWGLEEAGGG